ncbi:MAG TPA: type II toxin-antitoxin system VapC family toxin [Mycobacteriales bacterium]|nr:type II toxin-antitoxin system VapC family toxin [Mycobacteriales bacterium]
MSGPFFIDTNVFIYAVAEDSPYQAAAAETMEALGAGRAAAAATSVTVVEELWHQELSGRIPGLDGAADSVFTLMRPVLAVTDDILAAALDLKVRGLGANDRVHVATCHANGIDTILTADRGFDAAPGLRRVDPADLAEVRQLLARR